MYVAVVKRAETDRPHPCSRRREGEALTSREREILVELTKRDTLPQIAARLYISPNTLKSHLKSVYRKIGVASRGEAADLVEPSLARAV